MHRVGDDHPLLHRIFNQLLSSIALAVEHLPGAYEIVPVLLKDKGGFLLFREAFRDGVNPEDLKPPSGLKGLPDEEGGPGGWQQALQPGILKAAGLILKVRSPLYQVASVLEGAESRVFPMTFIFDEE